MTLNYGQQPPDPISAPLGLKQTLGAPVESFVDNLLRPLNFGIGPFNVPLGSWLSGLLHPFAWLIDQGLNVAWSLASDIYDAAVWIGAHAWQVVNEVAQEVIHDAEALFNGAVALATNLVNGAVNLARSLVSDALHTVVGWFGDAYRFVHGLVDDLASRAQAWVADALHTVVGWFGDAYRFVHGLVDDLAAKAQAWVGDALHTVVGWIGDVYRFVHNLVDGAVHDVEAWATDAIRFVDGVLRAFVRDFVDPVVSRLEAAERFLFGDVQTAVDLIRRAAVWLEWVTTRAVPEALDTWRALTTFNPEDAFNAFAGAAHQSRNRGFGILAQLRP